MKTIKSKKALEEMALSAGATVTGAQGRKFNTQKTQAAAQPRLEPDPEAKQLPKAEPKPEPVKADPGLKLLAEKIENNGKATVMILAALKEQISAIRLQSDLPVLDWDFEFVRDNKGYLTHIKAHAEAPERVLN